MSRDNLKVNYNVERLLQDMQDDASHGLRKKAVGQQSRSRLENCVVYMQLYCVNLKRLHNAHWKVSCGVITTYYSYSAPPLPHVLNRCDFV